MDTIFIFILQIRKLRVPKFWRITGATAYCQMSFGASEPIEVPQYILCLVLSHSFYQT